MKIKEDIKNFIYKTTEKISYRYRRSKKIVETDEKVKKYMNMSEVEFLMDYTEVHSRYEHKKLMFTVIFISILLSIVMESWNYFYTFLYRLLTSNDPAITNMVDVAMILSMIIMLSIIIVIGLVIFDMTRTLYKLNYEKVFLEEIKGMRKA